MEEENFAFFNSPVIRKNAPIKRLGLSRKRKSRDSELPDAKIPACHETESDSPSYSEDIAEHQERMKDTKDSENEDSDSSESYSEEMELLRAKITEKENKLKALQGIKNRVEQLENLIELWRIGCKNAILQFSKLVKEREPDNFDMKLVLRELGIWQTMIENYKDDSDISYLGNSQ